MPSIKVQGKVKKVSDIQTFASGFRKRELVVITEEEYSQFLNIEFVQEKCDLIETYREGESVEVDINLRGREWTSPEGQVRYFNTLQGWRIQRLGAENQNATNSQSQTETSSDKEDEDDLPF